MTEPPGPQERVPQHTVEPMLETFVPVPSLDVPVPQTVDQLEDVLKIVDNSVPEQLIEVPNQDLVPSSTSSCCLPRHADGGTAGGGVVGVPVERSSCS